MLLIRSDSGCWCGYSRSDGSSCSRSCSISIGLSLAAFPSNVSCLSASIAILASSIQRPSIRSCTVTRNVPLLPSASVRESESNTYQLATSIAFHSLCLAISSIVIRTSTFIASCWSWASSKTTSESTKGTSRTTCTTTHSDLAAWAVALTNQQWFFSFFPRLNTYSKMARKSTVVATPTCSRTTQSQGWAVGLDMT